MEDPVYILRVNQDGWACIPRSMLEGALGDGSISEYDLVIMPKEIWKAEQPEKMILKKILPESFFKRKRKKKRG